MVDIVLSTINASYIHSAMGLRCLQANLGDLIPKSKVIEFTATQRPIDMAEIILRQQPKIVGLGIYIWNAAQSTHLLRLLKRLDPQLCVVLGGPEVSHETEQQDIARHADYIVQGEGEKAFSDLCRRVLCGSKPLMQILPGALLDLKTLALPYDFYDDEDIQNRVVYVEASRGCPYRCTFCLSALDNKVRNFPLATLLDQLRSLLKRGLRHFKFVDRTFNLKAATATRILDFFLEEMRPGLFVHLEMVPDRLPQELRHRIQRFPPGTLQFEIGIQTLNPKVENSIRRTQDHNRLRDNLCFLLNETGVHLHTDLIIGLPGESLQSFARGFDQLVALGPQEIQVGILKRLRGAPIVADEEREGMRFNPEPPYDLLCNRQLDFQQMQELKRFALVWDRLANRGNFKTLLPLFWAAEGNSPFEQVLGFSGWLFDQHKKVHGIALDRLAQSARDYLVTVLKRDADQVAACIQSDYSRCQRRLPPGLLATESKAPRKRFGSNPDKRQARHRA